MSNISSKIADIGEFLSICEIENDENLLSDVDNELKTLEKEVNKLYLETLLNKPYDHSNAIMKIHSGAGGTESCDWVSMIFRMYKMYGEKHGYKISILDSIDGDGAGYKSIVYVPAELTDENAAKLTGEENMTAEKLKNDCRSYLEEEAAEKYKSDKMSLIFKAIVSAAQHVSSPTELIDHYYQQDVEYYEYYAPSYGMTYEELLEYVGLTDKTLRERAEANAMKDIAVYSIAKAENVTISDAEYEEKLASYAESLGYTKDEIVEMYTKEELIEQLTYNAVYDAIESWQNIVTE